jgi:hypothetical protein
MEYENFRSRKDSTLRSKPAGQAREPDDYADGGVRNADPEMARRVFRERDAQAVEGSAAEERMDRPGRFRAEGGAVPEVRSASSGRLKPGPAWLEGLRNGTQVQNNPSGKNDQQDVNRPRPVTY